MTEKELLYVEDAIGHEKSIISILNEYVNSLETEELKSFIQDEITKHEDNQNDLMNLLEVSSNE